MYFLKSVVYMKVWHFHVHQYYKHWIYEKQVWKNAFNFQLVHHDSYFGDLIFNNSQILSFHLRLLKVICMYAYACAYFIATKFNSLPQSSLLIKVHTYVHVYLEFIFSSLIEIFWCTKYTHAADKSVISYANI